MATYYWNGSAWTTTDSGALYTSKITYWQGFTNNSTNVVRIAYKMLWNDSTKVMTLQYWLNGRWNEDTDRTYGLVAYTGHDSSARFIKILSGSTAISTWSAPSTGKNNLYTQMQAGNYATIKLSKSGYNSSASGNNYSMPITVTVTSYAGTNLTPSIDLDVARAYYISSSGVTLLLDEWIYASGSLANGLPVPSLYSVTYNANNGSGAPSATTGVGSTTLSSTTPTRSGYSFQGWNTKADGTGTNYSAGGSITLTSNVTLYAKWQQTTFTITYNANGGSGTMANTTGNGSVQLRTNSFTRSGYNFLGWGTTSGATTVTYTNGQTINLTGNLNLYAVWQLATYTVSYNANGGSGAPSAQTKTHGVTLVLSATTPTRSNSSAGSYTVTLKANYTGGTDPAALTANRTTSYAFSKWNTASNGTGTNYNPSGNYTANAAATLYAQWNSNTTTAAVTLPSPTRSQYTFLGWATSSSGAVAYSGGASYTPTANVTLYAIWRANASTVSASNGTVGTAMNITISQQGSSYSYKHTLKWTINGTTANIVTGKTGSSATITQSWTPAIATIVPLYTDRKSYPCTITLQTYASDGTTLIGTTTTSITLTVPDSCAPALSGSVTPTNNPSGLTTKYVTGKSKAYFNYTATPQYSATIVSWKWTYNGTSTTETSSSTSKTYTTPNAVTATALSVAVTDSRGLTRTASTTATLLAYTAPTLTNITLARADSGGTLDSQGKYLKAVATATITSLDSTNTKTYKIEYRLESASTWTTLVNTTTLSNYTQSISYLSSSAILNESYSYVARITITDYYGSATATLTISTALSIMDFKANGLGVAFGKVHTAADKTVEIANDWKLYLGSRDINLLVQQLKIDQAYSTNVNIDGIGQQRGYLIRCNASALGTRPTALGNAFLLFGLDNYNAGGSGILQYGIQIAIGIGVEGMAVRLAPYNANGTTWNAWQYIYPNGDFRDKAFVANVDLNDYTSPGYYGLSTGLTNSPLNKTWITLVVFKMATAVVQVVFATSTLHYREYRSGAWNAWKHIHTSADTATTSSTVSDIATAGSNVTINNANWAQWGRTAQVRINFKCSSAINVGSNKIIATLTSDKWPAVTAVVQASDGSLAGFLDSSTGNVQIWPITANLAANTSKTLLCTYILA